LAPAAGAKTKKAPKPAGVIYTATNDTKSNAVVVFDRSSKGALTQRETVKTGGKGSVQSVGCGPGCPILDSVGAVDSYGKYVFTVNGGSDTVTSFIETSKGLKRVGSAPSGGDLPNSVTAYKGLVYVLNTNDGTISGLKYNSAGKLTPISGSTQKLFAAGNPMGPSGAARQVQFDPTGKRLVVDELGPGLITTFAVNASGVAQPVAPPPQPSAVPFPFGFAFTSDNTLILSEIVDGAANPPVPGKVTSYSFDPSTGKATTVSTLGSNGVLPCWVSITPDDQYAFVINTGAGQQAGAAKYAIGSDGTLTSKGVTNAPDGTFAWTDPVISADGKYFYIVAPGVMPGAKSRIDTYKISTKSSGHLKYLGSTKKNLPVGTGGLDGR
jgi:hypothetical protein